MEHIIIKADVCSVGYDELSDEERALTDAAMAATANSYSPYSGFSVGAALRLEDGSMVKGANQENAAFPVTMCAERAAIFNAQSNHPELAITHIAIAAKNAGGFVKEPVSPCGSCRQAILEMECRYKRGIKIYLCGASVVYKINTIKDILPLSFADGSMR